MVEITYKDLKPYIFQYCGQDYIKGGTRKVIRKYKGLHKCEICGIRHTKEHPLTFHHTNIKLFNISDYGWGKKYIKANIFLNELNSCQLLCRDCHDRIDNNERKEN